MSQVPDFLRNSEVTWVKWEAGVVVAWRGGKSSITPTPTKLILQTFSKLTPFVTFYKNLAKEWGHLHLCSYHSLCHCCSFPPPEGIQPVPTSVRIVSGLMFTYQLVSVIHVSEFFLFGIFPPHLGIVISKNTLTVLSPPTLTGSLRAPQVVAEEWFEEWGSSVTVWRRVFPLLQNMTFLFLNRKWCSLFFINLHYFPFLSLKSRSWVVPRQIH